MLQTDKFEVFITNTPGIIIPETTALLFLDVGYSRVAIKAFFKQAEILFHGKIHHSKGSYTIGFGKRYQKELGVTKEDSFKLQLSEDQTIYGVEMPEAFNAVLESDWDAMERFELLTPGKKRSLIYYVKRFKNVETQIDKVITISENLKMGITDQKELIKKLKARW